MKDDDASPAKRILLGHVVGVHGVRGWLKIHSCTDPRDAIFDYQPWLLGDAGMAIEVLEGKAGGKYLLARLDGVNTRDEADAVSGQKIEVERHALPLLDSSQFYWNDLVGLKVINQDGTALGNIIDMLATGANDVMVVSGERERLIPFVMDVYVMQVDLEQGFVKVDWDPEF